MMPDSQKVGKTSVPQAVARMMAEAKRQADAYDDNAVIDDESVAKEWPDHFDIDWMNKNYAFVLISGTAVIVSLSPDAAAHERVRFIKESGFKSYFGNRFVSVKGPDGKTKSIGWGEAYWTSNYRRTYDGIVFWPNPDGAPSQKGQMNLWQGYSVRPKTGGKYTIFKDHLFNNIAHGDERVFRWIFGWFAQMLQRPRDKPGSAIVLRGAMGAGKSIVGNVIGSLIQPHYFLVDDPRYVVGNFNAHMAACLLLQAEEAVWAGDKAAEGRLKGLVTSEFQMIEAKGVDPVRLPNFIRVMMTSNEDWVVPAGKDERRFAVFDIHPRCAGNHTYFAEMEEELQNGGREALLYDLLNFDLTNVNLRTIPKTEALFEQKVRSLSPIDSWLLNRLREGTPTRKHDEWPEWVPVEVLFNDYVEASEKIGIRRKADTTSFGMRMMKLLPSLSKDRKTIARDDGVSPHRTYVYLLPPLDDCRECFATQMQQEIDWG